MSYDPWDDMPPGEFVICEGCERRVWEDDAVHMDGLPYCPRDECLPETVYCTYCQGPVAATEVDDYSHEDHTIDEEYTG